MKKKHKSLISRIFTTALAFVVSITTLAGFGADLAAKAAVTLRLEQIHGNFWYFWDVNKTNGSAFCIQKGVSANSWDEYTAMYKDEYKYEIDGVDLTSAQKLALGMAQYYGYPNENNSRAYFCATQAIIWEIMDGTRSATTYKLTKSSSHTSELWSDELAAYNTISAKMASHKTVPSFDNKTAYLKWNASTHKYQASFYDYNDVVNKTNLIATLNKMSGVTATSAYDSSKGHYKITVTADKAVNTTVTANKIFETLNANYTDVIVYSNEWRGQALTSGVKIDDVYFTLKLATEATGDFFVSKKLYDQEGEAISSSNPLTINGTTYTFVDLISNARFKVYTSSSGTKNYLVLTQTSEGVYSLTGYSDTAAGGTAIVPKSTSGNFKVKDLPVDTYYIEETVRPNGAFKLISTQRVNVIADDVVTQTIPNYLAPQNPSVDIHKVWVSASGKEYGDYNSFVKGLDNGDGDTSGMYDASTATSLVSSVKFRAYIYYSGRKFYLSNYTQQGMVGRYGIADSYGTFTDGSNVSHNVMYAKHSYSSSTTTFSGPINFSTDVNDAALLNINPSAFTLQFNMAEYFAECNSSDWGSVTPTKINAVYFEEVPAADASDELHYWSSVSENEDQTLTPRGVPANGDRTVYNYERQLKVNIAKKDNETNQPVEGGEYGIYLVGGTAPIKTVTTDENGQATFTGISVKGDYYVKEITPPKGYTLDTQQHSVTSPNTSGEVDYLYKATYEQSIALGETPKKGTLNIHKKDDTEKGVKGITFSVTANKDITYNGAVKTAGTAFATLTTDDNGNASITDLPLDVEYTVTETSKSAPYVVVANTQTALLTDDMTDATAEYIIKDLYFTNTAQQVQVNVFKKDSDTNQNLAGAKIEIRAAEDFLINGEKVHSAGDLICTLTTKADQAVSNIENAVGGYHYAMYVGAKYTLTEVEAPKGYVLPTNVADRTKTIQITHSTTENEFYVLDEETFTNDYQTGSVSVYKLDSKNRTKPLAGAEFELTAAETIYKANGSVWYDKGHSFGKITTGANGKATFTAEVPVGYKYTVTETKAPSKYKIADEASQTFDLAYDSTVEHVSTEKTFYDDLLGGTLTIYKRDNDTKVGLSGAEFRVEVAETIYEDDNTTIAKFTKANGTEVELNAGTVVVDKLVTDANGKASYADLPFGKYKVVETKAPTTNFSIDNSTQTVELIFENIDTLSEEDLEKSLTFYDSWIIIPISITKEDIETHTKLEGAEFELIAGADVKKINGTVIYKKGDVIQTKATDKNGSLTFDRVPKSFSYIVREKTAPKDYVNNHPTQTITSLTAATTLTFTNVPMPVNITVYKQDEDTKVGLSGAKFNVRAAENIYNADGSVWAESGKVVATLTTGTDGKASTGATLRLGQYEIEEIVAPTLFNIGTVKKYVTAEYRDDVETINETVSFTDDRQFGEISVYKRDNETKVGLAGAKFTLKATADVKKADGTVYEIENSNGDKVKLTAGTVIDTITTGADGSAKFPEVPTGYSYTVEETAAPEGYVNAHEAQTFELSYNAEVEFVAVKREYFNDHQNGYITVTKKDGKYGDLLSGATFALMTTEDVKKADGTIKTVTNLKGEKVELKADTVIDTVTTDDNGIADFTTRVPVGYRYKLVEVQAPVGYVNAHQEYEFDLKYNAAVEYVPIKTTLNNKPIEVEISKRDAEGNELKGADMELVDKEGNVVDKWTSDGTNHLVSKLAAGEYTLKETAAPEGYTIATDIKFTVDDTNKVSIGGVEITAVSDDDIPLIVMYDSATKLAVSKKDMYGKELKGAQMQIINEKGEVVTAWTSDGTDHVITNLPVGTYTLHEYAAPKGYKIATDIRFTIDVNNKVTVNGVEVTATSDDDIPLVTMVDEATKVEFYKVDDEGNNLAGAKLRIVDSNGNVVKEWVSTEKPYVLEAELESGLEYTVEELEAPKGYCLHGTFSFTVSTKNGEIDNVTIEDKPTIVEVSKVSLTGKQEIAGAKMQILDSNGNVIDEWTSTDKPHVLRAKLIAGMKYYVHELTPPKGYIYSDDVEFNVSTDGSTDKVVMEDDDTKVSISKRDAYGNELKGATLQIINSAGTVVTEWTSDGTNKVIRNLPVGEYTLKETAAPDGYCIATAIKFTIDAYNNVAIGGIKVKAVSDDDISLIIMVDEATKVQFHKIDEEGNNLAGATLRVVDNKGNIVKEWVSDEKPLEMTAALTAGLEYKLEEVRQPAGYVLLGAFAFTVSTNGQLDIVTIKNRPTIVEVSKKALTGEDEVEGATMQILDEDGNVIDEWVSTTVPHVLKAQLEANKKYYVHEVTPPKFYILSEDVEFTVSGDGSVDEVVMRDDYTRGHIEVHKRSEGDLNVEGIEFILSGFSDTGVEVYKTAKTDENGIALFEFIPTGTYSITENGETVPTAYLVADTQDVTVLYAETSIVEFFNDEKTGTIEVHKRTEGDLNLEGIEFTLAGTSDSGREISLTATTDENGKVVFENVPVGTYTITENGETTPTAYLVADKQDVTVTYAETTIKEIYNEEKTGSIEVHKTTEGNLNIEGIEFILSGISDSGREISLTATTDENGKAVFENVPVGTYTITENGETTPTAYLVADKQDVTVTYAETTEVNVHNAEKTGSIKVQKKTEDMTNIAGIEFILEGTSDSGRKIRMTAVTDENGVAVFENIPIGTYTITENGDTVPTGYLVADKQSVTVYDAKETAVTFTNERELVPSKRPNAVTGSEREIGAFALVGLLIPLFAVVSIRRKKEEK